jgi:hypothetical protein
VRDAFGANAAAPDARFDCIGICLLLGGCEIVGIDAYGAERLTRK